MSLVSVIVPTKNRPQTLAQTLNSIFNQTYKNYEVIVINDGGRDVRPVIESFGKKQNIVYISREISSGPAAARNTGIEAARGKYIAYLDDDDIYYPDHLQTLVTYLENNKADVVYSDCIEAVQKKLESGDCVTQRKKSAYGYDFDRQKLLIKDYIPILTVMHRKECVENVGKFDERLGIHEDWDLWIRMSGTYEFHHIKETTAEFRSCENSDSITTNNLSTFLKIMKEIHERYTHLVHDEKIIRAQQSIIKKNEARIYQAECVSVTSMPPSGGDIDVTDAKISIILTLQNNTELFSSFLKAIAAQKKVGDVEIIVIDEGASEKSLTLAKEYSLKVVHSCPDSMNQGECLNLAVAESDSDFIVFAACDALPVSSYWLYHLIRPFKVCPEMSVNTCRSFVRPEADLYNLWINEARTKLITFQSDSVGSFFRNSEKRNWHFFDAEIKERLSYVNRISSCVKKSVFDDVQFSLSEDDNSLNLDFGIDLMEQGKATGFMVSTGVYHWSRRSAGHELRQAYVKAIKLRTPFNELPYFFDINNMDWDDVICCVWGLYHFMHFVTARLGEVNRGVVKAVRNIIDNINDNKGASPETLKGSLDPAHSMVDEDLDALMNVMKDKIHVSGQQLKISENFLFPIFMDRFSQFSEYICRNHQTLEGRTGEIEMCMMKIFAQIAGEVLGAYYLEVKDNDLFSDDMGEMHEILRTETPLSLAEISKQ